MFIGREKELDLIKNQLKNPSSSTMIYGKRKIGKTTLIKKALENHHDKTVYYECIKAPIKENIDGFVKVLVRLNILPVKMVFESFIDVFAYLNTQNENFNIVIDEYPYLKEFSDSKTVDSIFQSIIDNNISNIRLIISGSHIGMMKDLLEEGNALYGRFSQVLLLKELDYKIASAFYEKKSAYDKIAMYSVFGGSPYINELLSPSATLKENIINTLLNPSSAVYIYADNLLLSDLSTAGNMERIFYAIANGKKKYTEIQNKLSMSANGNLSKQMNILIDMELIAKVYPINKPDDNKKLRYEITDNLLRFFYAYIYANKSALEILGADAFYDEYIAPSVITFISYRFEEICRVYFSEQVKSRRLTGILNIGSYYYDDVKTKTNGEFDVVLKRKSTYDIYEVKYLVHPMSSVQIQKELEQINAIQGLQVENVGFISATGFEATEGDCIYLNGEDLYK